MPHSIGLVEGPRVLPTVLIRVKASYPLNVLMGAGKVVLRTLDRKGGGRGKGLARGKGKAN